MLPSTNPFAAASQQQYGGTATGQNTMSLRSFDGEAQPFSPEAQKYAESLLGSQVGPPLPVQGHPGYQAIMSVVAAGDKHGCPLCDIVDVIRQEEPHSAPSKISTPRQAMRDLCCHFYFGNTCLIVCKFWRSRIVWKALCYPLVVIILLLVIFVLLFAGP